MTRLTLKASSTVDFPDDVARMRAILNARGYDAEPGLIAFAWTDWSEDQLCSTWITVPLDHDDHVFEVLTSRLEPVPELPMLYAYAEPMDEATRAEVVATLSKWQNSPITIMPSTAEMVYPIPRWISVKERLPEMGVKVDTWSTRHGRSQDSILYWIDDDGEGSWNGPFGTYLGDATITHWMPIPAPPETKL